MPSSYNPPSAGLTSYTGSGATGAQEIAAGDIYILTVTVTGAALGMTCAWSASAGFGTNFAAVANVIVSANQVVFVIANVSAAEPAPISDVTFYARVFA